MTRMIEPLGLIRPAKIESDSEYIIIRPIGDVHRGNPHFDEQYWESMLLEIQNTPNMYWVGCGDYIENSNKRQKHGGVSITRQWGHALRLRRWPTTCTLSHTNAWG